MSREKIFVTGVPAGRGGAAPARDKQPVVVRESVF